MFLVDRNNQRSRRGEVEGKGTGQPRVANTLDVPVASLRKALENFVSFQEALEQELYGVQRVVQGLQNVLTGFPERRRWKAESLGSEADTEELDLAEVPWRSGASDITISHDC
jgi:hypothetical protein